jgi:hypothetical protein
MSYFSSKTPLKALLSFTTGKEPLAATGVAISAQDSPEYGAEQTAASEPSFIWPRSSPKQVNACLKRTSFGS